MEALFFSRNVTSALSVAEAKGVIRLTCLRRGIDLAEYSPVAVKQSIVGSGRADKSQVQDFIKLILKLPELPKPDHAADALGMAVCHIHTLGLS
jgi:crossover junction endodeoxyribonuclease RuvC